MMAKRSIKPSPKSAIRKGVVRARVPKIDELDKLLRDGRCVELAVNTLVEMCQATVEHFDKARGEMVLEVDGSTRVKAAQLLLAYSKGEPVKRQQILTGQMPKTPPTRHELKQTIENKIAAMVGRPDVTLNELVTAKKAISDAEAKEPMERLTEEEMVAKAKEIHGILS